MKNIILQLLILGSSLTLIGQNVQTIQLNPPDTTRGFPVMKALLLRESVRSIDTTQISLQDLSDLLWAANGVNRPASGKRTAPSALNAQDIDIYVFKKSGVYIYNAPEHKLKSVVDADHRSLFPGRQQGETLPPVICLLVSDISRFRFGEDSLRLVWAAMDAGIVSQNISIFCASVGLATVPRAWMDHQKIRELLNLGPTQFPLLNHPVGIRRD